MLGYVVVPVLTPEECARVHDELRQLRDTLLARQPEPGSFAELGSGSADPNFGRVRHNGAYMGGSEAKTNLMNLIEVGGSITGYAAHPRMVAMAEELIGAVRTCTGPQAAGCLWDTRALVAHVCAVARAGGAHLGAQLDTQPARGGL